MEPANQRSMVSAAQTGGELPPDLAWEILLRVPASSLCSFRAVCRSWRSLLSQPSFSKAHASSRPGVILALAGAEDRIDVVDYSGNVVRQINIPAAEEEGVPPPPLPAHPGPFYLFRARKRTRVLDPDTGAVAALPFDDLDVPSREGTSWYASEPCYTLWGGLSTGHLKVLRVATFARNARLEQLCDVLTLGDDQRCWRRRPSPPICITSDLGAQGVIIQGLAYFMADKSFPSFIMDASRDGSRRAMELMNSVPSFNLEREEWSSSTLRGPSAINTGTGKCRLKLAKLSNTLVMMHFDRDRHEVDLWFATDLKKSLWVKKLSVPRELLLPYQQMSIHRGTKLLRALDDERIVFSCIADAWTPEGPRWVARIYDSRTEACTDVSHQLGVLAIVGVYRGSFSMLGECNARFASQPTEAPSLREGRTSIL